MTIFFPDISSYEAGLTIQPGTVAVIAKATEGTYYRDAQYANFKAQAARVGAIFSAYHFLKAGNGAGQADYCHAMVGSTPVMLDVETEGTSKPTTQDCLDFIVRMRSLGGTVWGAYFPRWFWEQVGGNLASLGVAIVASGYPGGYSDTDPDWNPYGGVTPQLWQYTDKQPYGGQAVDFNAYKGTVQQLAALINGTTTPIPTPEGADVTPEEHNWLTNLYSGMFLGGSSCGSNTPAGKNGLFAHVEYITSMLQDLTGRPATPPPTPPVDVAALVKAVTDAVAAVIEPAVMAAIPPAQADVEAAIAEAVVAHLGIQVVAK